MTTDKKTDSRKLDQWMLSILSELIWRQFGQTLVLSSISRVMSLLGIKVQKPLYRAL